ncbi:MAG TPA: ABC transporter permease [Casimicrobiaceae bacterium]
MAELLADTALRPAARQRRRTRVPASLVWGAIILAVIVGLAAAAAFIAPYPYDEMNILVRLKPPSTAHWFGTDEYGRDVLSRTLVGARPTLIMGFGATAFSLLIGVPLGLVAGYRRGRIDEAIMRATDVLMSFPPILLGLLVLAVTTPALWKAMLAVGVVYIPPIVRLARSVTLDIAQEEFVLAAQARGDTARYILIAEILPNAWPPIAVEGSLRITFAILLGAALSFLGMGAQPPTADWGLMISEARAFIERAPWITLAPGITMSVTVVGINLLGDGLREVLDPRMRTTKAW